MERGQHGIAEAALRGVEDALEGEIVRDVGDTLQIGHRVADFGALVEARAADDAIGDRVGDETFLEFAHLERCTHEDRHLVEGVAVALEALDVIRDLPRFLLRIPGAGDRDAFAFLTLGEERLAEAALVAGDEMRGGTEDMPGRAVVTLQPDHSRAGKILLEAQDVVDLRAAPAIDGLVVVTDAADVPPPLRDQPQPEILRDVGILILVYQHVAEAILILRGDFGVVAEEADGFEQQIAEIDRIQRLESLLIERIELAALAGKAGGLARRHLLGR